MICSNGRDHNINTITTGRLERRFCRGPGNTTSFSAPYVYRNLSRTPLTLEAAPHEVVALIRSLKGEYTFGGLAGRFLSQNGTDSIICLIKYTTEASTEDAATKRIISNPALVERVIVRLSG